MGSVPLKHLVSRAEDVSEEVCKRTRTLLPTTARACLISTFLEDGMRMWIQWKVQKQYMDTLWGIGNLLATGFVLINSIGQLGGCLMVLLHKKVPYACSVLFFIVVLQLFAYSEAWSIQFFFRNLALVGALLLVLAESQEETRPQLVGVPTLQNDGQKKYFQLAGRSLLAFMFLTLIRFEMNFLPMLQNAVEGLFMVLVTIGYKTKLSALILVLFLTTTNFYRNSWWRIPDYSLDRDWRKYDFFHTLSVIGGLLMIVLLGPGRVSVDEHKKNW